MKQAHPNALGLSEPEIDFLLPLEKAFQIEFTQADADRLHAVGDVHDVLVEKLSTVGGSKCATMMAFLRLRKAFAELEPSVRLGPDTPLQGLSRAPPKVVWKHIRVKTGLNLPPLYDIWTGIGFLLCAAWLVCLFILALLNISQWWCAPLLVVGAIVMWLAPGSYGAINTLGDLARRSVPYNYGELTKLGARSSALAIWEALVELTEYCSEVSRDRINRETRLIF